VVAGKADAAETIRRRLQQMVENLRGLRPTAHIVAQINKPFVAGHVLRILDDGAFQRANQIHTAMNVADRIKARRRLLETLPSGRWFAAPPRAAQRP
jgi:hypothetical protein